MKLLGALVLVASALALLSLASPVAAQPAGGPCADDMKKLCADVQPGGGAKMKCLREHEAQLSDACKKRLEAMTTRRSEGPCAADVAKLCKDVQAGGGRIRQCLQQHQADLTPECKEQLAPPRRPQAQ